MRDVPTTVLDEVHRVLVGRSQAWIAALGHPLPVTFICDRPQVPKDLHEASAEMLLGALSTRST